MFNHLHVHTKYSLLDSTIDFDGLFNRLIDLGMNSIAITDHGNMYGSVEFYKKALEYGIKPIIGCEVYITEQDVSIMSRDNKMYHLILLAKNETGRLNLQKLCTIASGYRFNKRARIDFELLKQYHEGLVCLSACMAGELSRALEDNKFEKAVEVAKKYKDLFGDDYYIEYQAHTDMMQQELNKQLVELAKMLNIKYVVTCDAHYLTEEDQKYHDIFIQIGSSREAGEFYVDCYIQSEEEVLEKCKTTNEYNRIAIQNTQEIVDKCNVQYPLSAPIIPHAHIPDGFKDEGDYLKYLCNKGFKDKGFNEWTLDQWKRYMSYEVENEDGTVETKYYVEFDSLKEIRNIYKERAKYELESVVKMGFAGYYIMVYNYSSVTEERGIARGSAGGSLLAFMCGIVDIDPIKYGLYFERFIDVGALNLLEEGIITKKELKIPDVDMDFSKNGRDIVYSNIVNQYGEDKVVALGTFQYIKAKGAIKDIGRVLEIPFEITNAMTKQFGDESIQEVLELGLLDDYKKEYPELFVYAEKLAGLPKSFGMHPCFPKDTLVMTDNGYKKIQDVNVGDLVFTHNGRLKHVVKTMVNESNSFVKIKGIGLFEITSTLNHPYFVKHRTKVSPREYSDPEWIEAKDIKKTDMLCMPLNTNNVIPKYKNLPTDSKDFWWIVGRYIGDGWCEYYEQPRNEKRVIICCDKNTDDELIEITSKMKNMFEYRHIEERTVYKIFIKNKEMFEFLQRFGKYAHGKRFSNDIFDLPNDLLEAFLDGYTSADGYIKNGTISIKTVSYELANGIIQCVGKVYHKHCSVSTLATKDEIIEGRLVHSKKKYMVSFKKEKTKTDKNFYDEVNNCIWCYVKSNDIICTSDIDNVYNLSVVDDNTYTVNNVAVHNCGRVCCMDTASKYNALEYSKDLDAWVLQGDMHTADDLGLVKIDLLGLRTVQVIYEVLRTIGKDYSYIAPHKINLSDRKVFEEFKNGNSHLIFQFESDGMRNTLKNMKCNCINDLTAANALYRPGSKAYIPNYNNRKHDLEEITYIHDDLIPILSSTYGIIVFQEQLIEIGRLAGLRNPDELRQATAKKKIKLMNKIEPELKNGLMNRGWTQEQVDKLWEDTLDFAKYSFNKSHSAAYAIMAYISMYLKVYHPVEFISAYINSFDGKTDKISEVLDEARRIGVKYKFDKWYKIEGKTSCKDGIVYLGTNVIKGFGENVSESLHLAKENNPQNTYELFESCLSNGIKKNQLVAMIELDFFNEFGEVGKILKMYDLYTNALSKKQIKKEEFDLIPHDVMVTMCKETTKLYKDIDKSKMFEYLDNHVEPMQYGLKDMIMTKYEYLKVVDHIDEKLVGYGFVKKTNTKYAPKAKIYQFDTGESVLYKIPTKVFKENPFEEGQLIKIKKVEKKNKREKKGDKFVKVEDMFDTWIQQYKIL